MSSEQNDRLLELAYAGTPRGCRHKWETEGRDIRC